MLNKKSAMTYIEMIIVLGLIGFVASLTIPSMKKYSQRTEYGKLAQKAHLTLDQAIEASIFTNDIPQNWDYSYSAPDSNFFTKYIEPHIKKDAKNPSLSFDGMKFSFGSCDTQDVENQYCVFLVDVNGDKAPNQTNKDIFKYKLEKKSGNVYPIECAETLMKNNWLYSEEMWKAGNDNCDPSLSPST